MVRRCMVHDVNSHSLREGYGDEVDGHLYGDI